MAQKLYHGQPYSGKSEKGFFVSQISKASQNLVINGSLLTVTLATTTALMSGDSFLPDSVLIGFGLTSAGMLFTRLPRPKKSKWGALSSIAPAWSPDPDVQSFNMKWKPGQTVPDEFIFTGLDLPVPIPESLFIRFLTIARRRQTNALYGGRGLGLQGQIKRNWVLSAGHFTKRVRPCFFQDEFDSILLILGYTGLLVVTPRQGVAGRLLGDYGVNRYLGIAKRRWAKLASPPPRRNLWNFWGGRAN